MKPGTKIAFAIAGVAWVGLVLAGFLAIPSCDDKDARVYREMPSDRLRETYEFFREGFNGHKEDEEQCKQRGQTRDAERHHEDARACFKEMELIKKELQRRGKW